MAGGTAAVPVADDLTFTASRDTTVDEINALLKTASQGRLKGVLGYTEEKVVSTDFVGNSAPSTFDVDAGIALDSTFVKVVAWYDNEYGSYVYCLGELTRHIDSCLA